MRAARFPSVLSFGVLTVLSAPLSAQCLGGTSGTLVGLVPTLPPTYSADDEGRSAPIALGFAFPMPGGSFTHAVVDANGVVYLTNGGPAAGATDFGPQNGVDDLRGNPGDSPRVSAFWADLAAGIGWAVRTDVSVPGAFTVRWINVEDIGSSSTRFSCAVTLRNNGEVELAYGPLPASVFGYACVSIGDGVGTGLETSSVLQSGVNSGTLGFLFQEFFDDDGATLTGRRILVQPNGLGGYSSLLACRPAEHVPYGAGCYTYTEANEAMYQLFPNVAQSFAALPSGTSIQFSIVAANSYVVTNGGGTYVVPPGTATVLASLTDDSSVSVVPSAPFPHANGTNYATLSVSSNGFVSMAPSGVNPNGTGGSVSSLINAPAPSFRSQRDYNPVPAGSGDVKVHEGVVGGETIFYVTWENLYLYNTTTPERFQMQLNLTTGQVTIVWDLMTSVTPPTSKPLLVGCSPGSSFDPGPTVLATGLPVVTFPDVDQRPLTLAAAPAPVFTIGGPTVPVVYSVTNIPDAAPPLGIGLCFLIFSTAPLPGVDLGGLGLPGCDLYLASFDVIFGLGGLVGTDTLTLSIPQPLAPGLSFFSQALALFPPNSLPNGENAFGGILSNGVETHFNTF